MKIKVINPNTTEAMTEKIGQAAMAIAARGTTIFATNPASGPVSIEGHYDEAIATIGVLDEVRRGEDEGIDGYVIGCFGDPGLLAAREIARGPVVGIAEASMHLASLVSTSFSVVTTLGRTRVLAERLAEAYGMSRFCRNVRAAEVAVLDLDTPDSKARRRVIEECRRAVTEDHSGAVVLGCAGMAGLSSEIEREVGVPVIEGVAAAVKLVESLISLGIATSKVGDLAFPLPKQYKGAFEALSPKPRSYSFKVEVSERELQLCARYGPTR